MLGLAAYGSGSEDEDDLSKAKTHDKTTTVESAKISEEKAVSKLQEAPNVEPRAINGPILGPAQPSHITTPATNELGQSSPYSTSRSLIQDLTLPPVPNLEIPPSPPSSPNPIASGKVSQFLSLKKQGVHFNDKLSASSSLKNPSLFVKLREHSGIDYESQYATTLPSDIWDHTSLPTWAYKDELNKTQQAMRAKIEEAKQSDKNKPAMEFVPASSRDE